MENGPNVPLSSCIGRRGVPAALKPRSMNHYSFFKAEEHAFEVEARQCHSSLTWQEDHRVLRC